MSSWPAASFEPFRGRFRAALLAHHTGYWQAMRRLRLSLEDSEATVRALARLNSLEQLGQPLAEDAAVLRRLSRALGQQMTRLSSQAVHRILARARGERMEQFLQVVQASD